METQMYALECESMSCLSNEWSYLAITWAFSLLVVDAWIFFLQKTWEEVGRCGEDVMRKAGFLDGCYFCFFGFWLLHL